MTTPDPTAGRKTAPALTVTEVKYSLPELLAEVEAERRAPAYANEQLEKSEIAKLFQKNRPARVNRNRK